MSTPTQTPIRSVSYGGGVQSTALLVLAAQGQLDFRTFLMGNVGDDSENPATLQYLEEHAKPFAAEHNIELVVLDRVMVRSGETRTLHGEITRAGSKAQKIPVRLTNGKPASRACTVDYKIKVVGRELKLRGASAKNPATIGIGITLDEIYRANTARAEPHEIITYPLLEMRLRRIDCARIVRDAGLPIPPKSSCWFCPMHSLNAWHDQRRNAPELFEKSCQLEELMNQRQAAMGRKPVYLTRLGKPLREGIRDGVDVLPGFEDSDGMCDSGWCMT
ncbi:phosphoadenosine phosphosulfate reductase [Streptomyces bacillaris]|uniref:phosphoadenosine phosphosulfate reductase n=1 Tax=Streptomyces bacillaris TaxID=68179 RepID=UPI00345FE325